MKFLKSPHCRTLREFLRLTFYIFTTFLSGIIQMVNHHEQIFARNLPDVSQSWRASNQTRPIKLLSQMRVKIFFLKRILVDLASWLVWLVYLRKSIGNLTNLHKQDRWTSNLLHKHTSNAKLDANWYDFTLDGAFWGGDFCFMD